MQCTIPVIALFFFYCFGRGAGDEGASEPGRRLRNMERRELDPVTGARGVRRSSDGELPRGDPGPSVDAVAFTVCKNDAKSSDSPSAVGGCIDAGDVVWVAIRQS